jgi:hypothetical protein
MAMKDDIRQRELDKFVQSPTRTDGAAVEITGNITATASPGPFAPPAGTDAFTRSVAGNTETIEYRTGGIAGAVLKTIKVYYLSAPDPDLTGGELI